MVNFCDVIATALYHIENGIFGDLDAFHNIRHYSHNGNTNCFLNF